MRELNKEVLFLRPRARCKVKAAFREVILYVEISTRSKNTTLKCSRINCKKCNLINFITIRVKGVIYYSGCKKWEELQPIRMSNATAAPVLTYSCVLMFLFFNSTSDSDVKGTRLDFYSSVYFIYVVCKGSYRRIPTLWA